MGESERDNLARNLDKELRSIELLRSQLTALTVDIGAMDFSTDIAALKAERDDLAKSLRRERASGKLLKAHLKKALAREEPLLCLSQQQSHHMTVDAESALQ